MPTNAGAPDEGSFRPRNRTERQVSLPNQYRCPWRQSAKDPIASDRVRWYN